MCIFCFILFPDASGDEFKRYQLYKYSSPDFFPFLLISTTRFEIMGAKKTINQKRKNESKGSGAMTKRKNENLITSKNINNDGITKDAILKCIDRSCGSRAHYE